MMRKTFIALAAGLLLAACAEKAPERGALILGEASGFNPQDSIAVLLLKWSGLNGKVVQMDTLRGGQFSFRLDSLADDADNYTVMFHSFNRDHIYGFRTVGYGPEIYLEPGVAVRLRGDGRYYENARIDSPVKDQKLRQRFVEKLQQRGGIDLLVLGLGENGHLGFNQPGTPFESTAWVTEMNAELEERIRCETATPADKWLGGVTLGIRDIMQARRIVLVAKGKNKADIVQSMLLGPVTTDVPASILQLHPCCEFLLDADASSKL